MDSSDLILDTISGPSSQSKKEPTKKENLISLSSISDPVLQIVKEKGPLSFPEVANCFLLQQNFPPEEIQKHAKNIKRRISDVLNVLLACNVLIKDGKRKVKIFTSQQKRSIPDFIAEEEVKKIQNNRIQEKMQHLISKTRLLIYYTLLIDRNKTITRTAENVQMPAIIIGYSKDDGKINRKLDGKELTVYSTVSPLFFSPENIFHKLGFTVANQVALLKAIRYLGPVEKEIIEAIKNDQIDEKNSQK